MEKLLEAGVNTIQLRIKDKTGDVLEQEIIQAIQLAKTHKARLFINDYWQLALKHNAYGVHLGQEDLQSADLAALANAGIRLGISTHGYFEVARAHAIRPSYMAIGPIYETTSKLMPHQPQGLSELKRFCRLLDYPLVAIGGINLERLPDVLATEVTGVAVISAITKANDPVNEAKRWLVNRVN